MLEERIGITDFGLLIADLWFSQSAFRNPHSAIT